MLFSDSTHFCYTLTLISTTSLVKMHLEQPCGCVAMKAPVGLSSRRAVCVSRWRGFALTSVRAATNAKNKNQIPLNMPRVQQRRPLPAAETGRNCWGRGQRGASTVQGTMRMLGAATRAAFWDTAPSYRRCGNYRISQQTAKNNKEQQKSGAQCLATGSERRFFCAYWLRNLIKW